MKRKATEPEAAPSNYTAQWRSITGITQSPDFTNPLLFEYNLGMRYLIDLLETRIQEDDARERKGEAKLYSGLNDLRNGLVHHPTAVTGQEVQSFVKAELSNLTAGQNLPHRMGQYFRTQGIGSAAAAYRRRFDDCYDAMQGLPQTAMDEAAQKKANYLCYVDLNDYLSMIGTGSIVPISSSYNPNQRAVAEYIIACTYEVCAQRNSTNPKDDQIEKLATSLKNFRDRIVHNQEPLKDQEVNLCLSAIDASRNHVANMTQQYEQQIHQQYSQESQQYQQQTDQMQNPPPPGEQQNPGQLQQQNQQLLMQYQQHLQQWEQQQLLLFEQQFKQRYLARNQHLKRSGKETGESYNMKELFAEANGSDSQLSELVALSKEAIDTTEGDLKAAVHSKDGVAPEKVGTVEFLAESNHIEDHAKNTQSLIAKIASGDIGKDTVIAIERKSYGNNLGVSDVILLASILEHNEQNANEPKKQLKIPAEIKEDSLIYQDALLYNEAKKHGIKVIGLEGKGLTSSKELPEDYNREREDHMASRITELTSKGYNVIAHVGSAHVENLQERVTGAKTRNSVGAESESPMVSATEEIQSRVSESSQQLSPVKAREEDRIAEKKQEEIMPGSGKESYKGQEAGNNGFNIENFIGRHPPIIRGSIPPPTASSKSISTKDLQR
jgi:uncharacterized protein (DUF2164 family)